MWPRAAADAVTDDAEEATLKMFPADDQEDEVDEVVDDDEGERWVQGVGMEITSVRVVGTVER